MLISSLSGTDREEILHDICFCNHSMCFQRTPGIGQRCAEHANTSPRPHPRRPPPPPHTLRLLALRTAFVGTACCGHPKACWRAVWVTETCLLPPHCVANIFNLRMRPHTLQFTSSFGGIRNGHQGASGTVGACEK